MECYNRSCENFDDGGTWDDNCNIYENILKCDKKQLQDKKIIDDLSLKIKCTYKACVSFDERRDSNCYLHTNVSNCAARIAYEVVTRGGQQMVPKCFNRWCHKFYMGQDMAGSILEEKNTDITEPSHYTQNRKYEPLDVIEDWQLPHHLACVVKYIARAGRKECNTEIQDLQKAQEYLRRYIEWKENANNAE